MYGFSNSSQFSNNRAYSAGVSYTHAGFNIGAGYLQLNNDISGLTSAAVTNSGGAVAGDNTFVGKRQRVFGGGLNYIRPGNGRLRVHAIAREPGARHLRGASGVSNGLGLDGTFARFNNYEVNAATRSRRPCRWPGRTYTAGFLDGRHPGWNQFNLQTDYALSKRTDVYVQGVYQRVSTDGLGIGAYVNGLGGASSTNKQIAVTPACAIASERPVVPAARRMTKRPIGALFCRVAPCAVQALPGAG